MPGKDPGRIPAPRIPACRIPPRPAFGSPRIVNVSDRGSPGDTVAFLSTPCGTLRENGSDLRFRRTTGPSGEETFLTSDRGACCRQFISVDVFTAR